MRIALAVMALVILIGWAGLLVLRMRHPIATNPTPAPKPPALGLSPAVIHYSS